MSDTLERVIRCARLAPGAPDRARLPRGGSLCVLGAGGVGTHVLHPATLADPSACVVGVVRSESCGQGALTYSARCSTASCGSGPPRGCRSVSLTAWKVLIYDYSSYS